MFVQLSSVMLECTWPFDSFCFIGQSSQNSLDSNPQCHLMDKSDITSVYWPPNKHLFVQLGIQIQTNKTAQHYATTTVWKKYSFWLRSLNNDPFKPLGISLKQTTVKKSAQEKRQISFLLIISIISIEDTVNRKTSGQGLKWRSSLIKKTSRYV